jgi:hypothetical protein
VYKKEAPKLALKACEKAMADWGGAYPAQFAVFL